MLPGGIFWPVVPHSSKTSGPKRLSLNVCGPDGLLKRRRSRRCEGNRVFFLLPLAPQPRCRQAKTPRELRLVTNYLQTMAGLREGEARVPSHVAWHAVSF